ncbi:unnamed protein product [Cercopithifilaria johnstoni]|uniref:C2H2-type domain-containing protein n=1 Tax=Cercopithifilaria johnstoni TaxID=2874296 RepID=A0A8J2PVQ8_9BILA|nr:unnamed protein product [Cercopithifilaria johnstoni]
MYLSYLVLLVLPLYVAQIVVSNEGDWSMQADLRNDNEIRTVADDCKANEKRYKCEICDKQLGYAGSLKRHKMIHTGEKNYICKRTEETPSDARKRAIIQMLHVQ